MLSSMSEKRSSAAPTVTKKVTFYMPDALYQQARIFAVRNRTTLTALLVEGLRARLKERPAEVAVNE
jgi:hypothetical protein